MLFVCYITGFIATVNETLYKFFSHLLACETRSENNEFTPLDTRCLLYQNPDVHLITGSLCCKEFLKSAMRKINLSHYRLSNDASTFHKESTYSSARGILRNTWHVFEFSSKAFVNTLQCYF